MFGKKENFLRKGWKFEKLFRYKDKVLIIKDPENDGFFEGTEGVLLTREEVKLNGKIEYVKYGVDIGHYLGCNYCKEDEIQFVRHIKA